MLKKSLISLIFILFLWQIISLTFDFPKYMFPSPYDVFLVFLENGADLRHQFFVTGLETLLGMSIGAMIGLLFALLLIIIPVLKIALLPLMLISQALPIFALAPILVLWLGFGFLSKLSVVVLMTFFPIASSFFDGLNKTPQSYLKMAYYMRSRKINLFRYIYIPYALPYLASGLRVSAVFAPMGAIIGEWVGATQGLGYLMINANARLDTSSVFAAIILLVILALALYFFIDIFFKWSIKW